MLVLVVEEVEAVGVGMAVGVLTVVVGEVDLVTVQVLLQLIIKEIIMVTAM